jgi:hypothetical protein
MQLSCKGDKVGSGVPADKALKGWNAPLQDFVQGQ